MTYHRFICLLVVLAIAFVCFNIVQDTNAVRETVGAIAASQPSDGMFLVVRELHDLKTTVLIKCACIAVISLVPVFLPKGVRRG